MRPTVKKKSNELRNPARVAEFAGLDRTFLGQGQKDSDPSLQGLDVGESDF